MQHHRPACIRSALVLCLLLSACGGGGGSGSGVASTPTPPTPPPPPPPPPPPGAVNIFANVTTTTDFAVRGLERSGATTIGNGFSVRYDAAQQAYIFDTPFFAPGKFAATSEDATSWTADSFATVQKPKPANPNADFQYTTFATYYGCPWDCFTLGFFAFGLATPQSAVPTTGSATYDALVAGSTSDADAGGYYNAIGGTASLQFNFGTGTLAGHFDPVFDPNGRALSLGQYDFVNTVYGVGSTTFSGDLSHSGTAQHGSFDGLFSGPAAEELMARWTAPYLNPDTKKWSDMFGVWVGAK